MSNNFEIQIVVEGGIRIIYILNALHWYRNAAPEAAEAATPKKSFCRESSPHKPSLFSEIPAPTQVQVFTVPLFFPPYHDFSSRHHHTALSTNQRSGRYKYAGSAGLSLCSASSHQPLSSQTKLTAAVGPQSQSSHCTSRPRGG